MTTTLPTALPSFAERFGFSALLVLLLLWAIWRMQERAEQATTKRQELEHERERERTEERERDREAHLVALKTLEERFEATAEKLGEHIDRLTEAVRKHMEGERT